MASVHLDDMWLKVASTPKIGVDTDSAVNFASLVFVASFPYLSIACFDSLSSIANQLVLM